MPRIISNWDLDGVVDEQRYYRSESTMNVNNMPAPAAILGSSDRSYSDTSIVANTTYYIRVSSVKGGIEKISDEVVISTSSGDIYFDEVLFLIFADAAIYPSKNIIDTTSRSIIAVDNPANIVNTNGSKYDDGAIKIDAYKGEGGLNITTPSNIGLSDFTLEFHMKRQTFFDGWLLKIGGIYAIGGDERSTISIQSWSNGSIKIRLINQGNLVVDSSFSALISNSLFNHVCLMRKSGIIYLFLDGVRVGFMGEPNHTNLNINNKVFFGLKELVAYFNSIRMTAVARYPETGFTPPSEKYQSI